jgi:hypothetical protein
VPVVTIQGGARVNVPDQAEIAAIVAAQLREMYRGVKWMRLPVMQATVAATAVTLDDTNNPQVGPEQGYAWSLTRVVVDGMATGSTPDVVNMFRNAETSQPPLWQFNGNNFGYTFGLGQVVLLSGDRLQFKNSGALSATGLIRATGELVEVPAEMLGKLLVAG